MHNDIKNIRSLRCQILSPDRTLQASALSAQDCHRLIHGLVTISQISLLEIIRSLRYYENKKIVLCMKRKKMGIIEATVSISETMPEETRLPAFNYTKELFSTQRPANPFTPINTDKLHSDLEESRRQIEAGEGKNMKEALREMGKQHGFI